MERQRKKLRNEDSTRTTFHYNTRSSSRRGIATSDRVDESASLRVTKEVKKKKVADERSLKPDLQLPIDLIMEVLKRLPVKTLAKFLCVSKIWGSIIRSRDLRKLFLAESSNRPGRLFFTFKREDNDCLDCLLFSWNQTESAYHLSYLEEDRINSASCVHDLICYVNASRSELLVYNSTTKRSITLPTLEPPGSYDFNYFLCYDPIDAVYKVLSAGLDYRILTLGNGNEWRMVEDPYIHFPFNSQICINGVLYYDADVNRKVGVMSFDVRSEKFHLIKGPGSDNRSESLSTLTRYEGKLAITSSEISDNGSVDLWVLEDTEKHEWLKKTFVLPNSWTSLAQDTYIPSPPHEAHVFLNITIDGEFILAPMSACLAPFYVLFYDPKRNSMRKVSIEEIMDNELLHWSPEKPWFLYSIFSSQTESLALW